VVGFNGDLVDGATLVCKFKRSCITADLAVGGCVCSAQDRKEAPLC
jgi:hypothetical protein